MLCGKCRKETRVPGQRWGAACRRNYMREYMRTRRVLKPEVNEMNTQANQRKLLKLSGYTQKPDTCEVCGRGGKICFDHSHANGEFRGWLCNHCNLVLGHVGDDPVLLRKLADYLELRNVRTKARGESESPLQSSLA